MYGDEITPLSITNTEGDEIIPLSIINTEYIGIIIKIN